MGGPAHPQPPLLLQSRWWRPSLRLLWTGCVTQGRAKLTSEDLSSLTAVKTPPLSPWSALWSPIRSPTPAVLPVQPRRGRSGRGSRAATQPQSMMCAAGRAPERGAPHVQAIFLLGRNSPTASSGSTQGTCLVLPPLLSHSDMQPSL